MCAPNCFIIQTFSDSERPFSSVSQIRRFFLKNYLVWSYTLINTFKFRNWQDSIYNPFYRTSFLHWNELEHKTTTEKCSPSGMNDKSGGHLNINFWAEYLGDQYIFVIHVIQTMLSKPHRAKKSLYHKGTAAEFPTKSNFQQSH